jgi:thiosulfate/3-mercaptopyruvate sulfurtransferase
VRVDSTLFPVTLLLVAGAASPAPFGAVRIVDATEAARRLPDVSVLDARSARDVSRGHVPGSRRVDWREWTLEKPGLFGALFGDPARWGRVPPPDALLENRLRALGLSNARPILVVGAPGGWGEEGRVAWNLLYWGAAEVWMLNGGFPAWRADSARPVETGAAREAAPGDFVLRVRPERRIETAALKATLDAKRPALLDARTPAEFAGETMSGQKRGGHLPGARLGVLAANYDGSLWEWSADPSLPLVK